MTFRALRERLSIFLPLALFVVPDRGKCTQSIDYSYSEEVAEDMSKALNVRGRFFISYVLVSEWVCVYICVCVCLRV